MANDPRSPFSSSHPLAGKIATGVRTTENRARRANTHQSMAMQEAPVMTLADRAQQMFSMDDKKGTRVYYARSGVFNTVDDKGSSINFIRGLFKTNNRSVMNFLQQFVDSNYIDYLELQEDASNAEVTSQQERSPGRTVDEPRLQLNQPESQLRDEPQTEPDRSGPGGEDAPDEQQQSDGTAVSGGSGDGDDSEGEEVTEPKPSALDLIRRAKK